MATTGRRSIRENTRSCFEDEASERTRGVVLKAAKESFGAIVDAAEQDVRKNVSCLLIDAFLIFAGEMAKKMQVPWVTLWVPAPYLLAAHVYIDVISELLCESSGGGTSTDDDDKSRGVIPGLSMMRISDLPNEIIDDQDTSRIACLLREMGRVIPICATAVVMNSYAKVNPTPLIADLKSKFKMLLQAGCLTVSFPLSPLPSSSASDTTGCLTWLDARDPRSVVYICFGTVAMLSPSEVLALGESFGVY
ncbi:flavonoid 3-O-glucosyltransferase-like [Eucalyptus grandis]|uniref:flavonoid 3-O-glucosyltransferase-like n=1 Tax=Eucalyptus grandis TaxID=71139 RepID=UPI00192EA456|nr:flavonoid 3-O-glucosyltransferase-like [Eucalyptus grandis]